MITTKNNLPDGTVLNRGRQPYRIIHKLGQGGFGITYKVTTPGGRIYVVKELFIQQFCSRISSGPSISIAGVNPGQFDTFKQKFIREAATLGKIRHPHIVRIIDEFEENDTAYYVMEYIDGRDLRADYKKNLSFNDWQVFEIAEDMAESLTYLHGLKTPIYHRDIKPSNIMISNGKAVLVDFGNAKEFEESTNQQTNSQILTKGYAPIELFSTKTQIGPYTDLFSLGATLYYLLVGRNPLPVTDRVLMQKGKKDILEIEYELEQSNASPIWKPIVSRLLEFEIEDRYANAGELLADLDKVRVLLQKDFISFDKEDFSGIKKNEPLEDVIIEEQGTSVLEPMEDVEMTSVLKTPAVLEKPVSTEIIKEKIKNNPKETSKKKGLFFETIPEEEIKNNPKENSAKKKGLFLEEIPEDGINEAKKTKGFLWILLALVLLMAGAYFLLPLLNTGEGKIYYYSIMKNGADIQIAEKDSTDRPYAIADNIEDYYLSVDQEYFDMIKSHLAANMDRYYDHNDITNTEVIDLYSKYNNKLSWSSNNPIWETMDMTEKENGSFEVRFSMNYNIMMKSGKLKKYLEDIVIVVDKDNYFKSIYLIKSQKLN